MTDSIDLSEMQVFPRSKAVRGIDMVRAYPSSRMDGKPRSVLPTDSRASTQLTRSKDNNSFTPASMNSSSEFSFPQDDLLNPAASASVLDALWADLLPQAEPDDSSTCGTRSINLDDMIQMMKEATQLLELSPDAHLGVRSTMSNQLVPSPMSSISLSQQMGSWPVASMAYDFQAPLRPKLSAMSTPTSSMNTHLFQSRPRPLTTLPPPLFPPTAQLPIAPMNNQAIQSKVVNQTTGKSLPRGQDRFKKEVPVPKALPEQPMNRLLIEPQRQQRRNLRVERGVVGKTSLAKVRPLIFEGNQLDDDFAQAYMSDDGCSDASDEEFSDEVIVGPSNLAVTPFQLKDLWLPRNGRRGATSISSDLRCMAMSDARYLAEARRVDAPLSFGSVLHHLQGGQVSPSCTKLMCRPCMFEHWPGRCKKSILCDFCHMHEDVKYKQSKPTGYGR